MDHSIEAQRLFREGYNCSQAVFCAFCDETGLDTDLAAQLSSSFGGGIGRLREVCGAVSGAMMALGALRGYSDISDPDKKIRHYERVQEFARRFREKNGSIICRELLKGIEVTEGVVPEARTPEFYEKRPCLRLIGEAAAILDDMLAE
ncbi:MAG: C_GCAxxG_C_C family protein [Oscillospiraceae bacterium]|nr:C_GCAxxG_C_C family protein [Oscillospiraceae bacterium]